MVGRGAVAPRVARHRGAGHRRVARCVRTLECPERMNASLERGRAAYERQAWSDAYESLVDADRAAPLGALDLDRLSTAAHLIGLDDASGAYRTRAFQLHLDAGETRRAAASALWRVISLAEQTNRQAEIGGWLARAGRLLSGASDDCLE